MIFFLLSIFIFLILPNQLKAEKIVGGIIFSDTKWIAEEGPYIVEKDILVKSNARLSITSGTRILIRNYPIANDSGIYQIDKIDSQTVSIKVEGTLTCLGRQDKRISFIPIEFFPDKYSWYGITFINAVDTDNEIFGTDITGAYNGISIINSSPMIRATVLEYNHIGINCRNESTAKIYNCIIARNFATGIFASKSNPHIANNIICYNRNNGLWCDGLSKIFLEYNCFFENHDGNFLECDPEFGILVKKNQNNDSIDLANNIFIDPVFAGSVSDSLATEKDYNLPTIKSRVKDTTLAAIIYEGKPLPQTIFKGSNFKYELSRYSPCIDAGHKSSEFNDLDRSRNDMGIDGGPDYIKRRK